MCVTGAVYLKDCPVERFIPIYLVVAGACALFPNVMGILQSIFMKKDSDQQPSTLMKMCSLLESLVSCFMFAWFIAGQLYLDVWPVIIVRNCISRTHKILTNSSRNSTVADKSRDAFMQMQWCG